MVSLAIVLVFLASGLVTGHAQAMGFAAGDSVVVDTDLLNLRTGAGLTSAVIDVLESGTVLTVTDGPKAADGYSWYKIRTGDGTSGWVAGEFLAFVQARFAAGDRAVVDAPRLNCRSGPGLSAGVTYVMDGGTRVTILAGPTTADGYHWYKVRTDDGDVGWTIGEGLAPESGNQGADFAKGAAVVVNTDALNLRIGAGLAKSIVAVLPDGTPLIVSNGPMAVDGYDWYEVETRDGQLGWVAGQYLAAASDGFAAGDAVRVTGGPLNLRAEPGLAATVLRVMAGDEVLLVLDDPVEADGYTWYPVRNDAGTGWAAGEFLRFDSNGFPPEEGK
jgi:N-acetylmuramoyl-L-alanine amidase